jgi:hypothetical protein
MSRFMPANSGGTRHDGSRCTDHPSSMAAFQMRTESSVTRGVSRTIGGVSGDFMVQILSALARIQQEMSGAA